jgi:hypothetical protein
MADRRTTALDELAIAVAEATVDAWLDGKLVTDGLEPRNDKGCQHDSADKAKAPAKRRARSKTTKPLRNVRGADRV